MIVLLEPARPPGFVSGGYRYQDEIARRLAARGEARQVAIAPDRLAPTIAALRDEGVAAIVVDGLFAALTGRPLPAAVTALLHTAPAREPWCEAPLPVIATSAPTAAAVRATAAGVAIVRPGIDPCFTPSPAPVAEARLRIVCVGTVCAAKGQALLVAAAAAAQPTACEVVLVGDLDGAPADVAAVRAAAGGLTLRLTGCIPPTAVAAELQRADLVVSASRSESFGMAVAEAVACGAPVLAFATGEIGTFVRDGDTGWLLPPDAPAATFTRALHELLAAPARLRDAGSRARRLAGASARTWDAAADEFAAAMRAAR